MKVAYLGGFWATNIGNAFYDLGAVHMLKNVFGQNNVFLLSDIESHFWRTSNAFPLIENTDMDLYLLAGPIFNIKILYDYRRLFIKARECNKKIAFISSGGVNYSQEEVSKVKQFLNEFADVVLFISTRDKQTFQDYQGLKIDIHNGLCTSMFLKDAVNVPSINKSYYALCFDRFNEPKLEIDRGLVKAKHSLLKRKVSTINGLPVIRTNHGIFSKFSSVAFHSESIYYSDIPFGYLTIYKNCETLFSNRVHACAAALIFETKAMYFANSRRSKDSRNLLFERLGVPEILEKPVMLNQDYINEEKNRLVSFVRAFNN